MTRKRFHGLKKVKVRATWNKYNLFNLSRLRTPYLPGMTYYQQKWGAKSLTRAYHGEQIREKQWQRMFTPWLNSVIPMDHKYLAEHDGSEHAAGRGSGLERPVDPNKIRFGRNQIPYMHMTYAPIERRLDMAIFRALFASSARQARQFVIHGKVKVNGQKMPYPGYLLNPGDMFQVEPERVLFATGAPKTGEQVTEGRRQLRILRRTHARRDQQRTERKAQKAAKAAEKPASETSTTIIRTSKPKPGEEEVRRQRRADLEELRQKAQSILGDGPGANRKKELRAFISSVKGEMAKLNRKAAQEVDNDFINLVSRLSIIRDGPAKEKPAAAATEKKSKSQRELSPNENKALQEAINRIRQNPVDETKPYATPWRPRPFMSAFAFVPRYLEVNHNICSAVYLRHPVARPGLSEVPTPFPAEQQQLAFNWYLRRR